MLSTPTPTSGQQKRSSRPRGGGRYSKRAPLCKPREGSQRRRISKVNFRTPQFSDSVLRTDNERASSGSHEHDPDTSLPTALTKSGGEGKSQSTTQPSDGTLDYNLNIKDFSHKVIKIYFVKILYHKSFKAQLRLYPPSFMVVIGTAPCSRRAASSQRQRCHDARCFEILPSIDRPPRFSPRRLKQSAGSRTCGT